MGSRSLGCPVAVASSVPDPQMPAEGIKRLRGIIMQLAKLPAGRSDPAPLPHQGGAAEQVRLERQMVEAPAVGGGIDAHQGGRFGEQRQLARWPDRGLWGAFGHVFAISVTRMRGQGTPQGRPQGPCGGQTIGFLGCPVTL